MLLPARVLSSPRPAQHFSILDKHPKPEYRVEQDLGVKLFKAFLIADLRSHVVVW